MRTQANLVTNIDRETKKNKIKNDMCKTKI